MSASRDESIPSQSAEAGTKNTPQPSTPEKLQRPPANEAEHQATPLIKKTAGDFPCTSGHVLSNPRMRDMAEEAEGHILGPMPLETFLEKFLPEHKKGPTSDRKRKKMNKKLREMALCTHETFMYPIFIEAVKDLCPKFPTVDTHKSPFKDVHGITVKPDVCFFEKKWLKAKSTGISTVELIAELKISLNDDAFISNASREPSKYVYSVPQQDYVSYTEDDESMKGKPRRSLSRILGEFLVGQQNIASMKYSMRTKYLIPTILGSVDIEGQRTVVQDLCEKNPPWANNGPLGLRGFQRYRLKIKEIGRVLTEFSSTKELVSAIHLALKAHESAYCNAGILHRDISVGNIMFCEKEKGQEHRKPLLLDWDMAKFTDDRGPSARERTGTWQFLAARLTNTTEPLEHTLQDDLESFVHVLSWITFRFTPVAYDGFDLYSKMHLIFDYSYRNASGQSVGGTQKMAFLKNNDDLDKAKIKNRTLHRLIESIKETVAVRYEPIPEVDAYSLKPVDSSYGVRMQAIQTSTWMIGIFGEFLTKEPWPTEDEAKENEVAEPSQRSTRKRATDVEKYIAAESAPTKRRKMSAITERSNEE